ncbi:MAG TPA: DUF6164 family protein [Candidatus Acidoferrum sp.]|nr:DUF6164 family protein [Candidatus Acidoferrum sp.]
MGQLLMTLHGVPADELDEVHALLQSQGIDYYESAGSTFGIASPALWLRDDSQFVQARQLLDQYALERAHRMREQREAEVASGTHRSFASMFAEHPLRFVAYLALVLGMLYAATVQVWISAR